MTLFKVTSQSILGILQDFLSEPILLKTALMLSLSRISGEGALLDLEHTLIAILKTSVSREFKGEGVVTALDRVRDIEVKAWVAASKDGAEVELESKDCSLDLQGPPSARMNFTDHSDDALAEANLCGDTGV